MTEASYPKLSPLTLASGRACRLACPDVPWLADYYVLTVESSQGPENLRELDELALLAHQVGRRLATQRFGDPECYSVIFNAGRTRCKPWPHYHLLLVDSVYAKRRAFALLQLKHVLRWLRAKTTRYAGRAAC